MDFGAFGRDPNARATSNAADPHRIVVDDLAPFRPDMFTSSLYRPGIEILGAGPAQSSLRTTVVGVDLASQALLLSDAVVTPVIGAAVRADDSVPIQAAVDFALGGPATYPVGNRKAQAPVYLPAADHYRCTHGIAVRGAVGFHLVGDGPMATSLRVAPAFKIQQGDDVEALLDLDGVAYSIFEGFTLETAEPSSEGSMPAGEADFLLYLHWSGWGTPPDGGGFATTHGGTERRVERGTTGVTFRDITVGGLKVKTGFRIGDNNLQVDGCSFYNCRALGRRDRDPKQAGTWDSWDFGWHFGRPSTYGNNLSHGLFGCEVQFVKTGISADNVPVHIFSGQSEYAETDFAVTGDNMPFVVDGWRSEHAAALLSAGVNGGDSHVTLRNIQWNAADVGDRRPRIDAPSNSPPVAMTNPSLRTTSDPDLHVRSEVWIVFVGGGSLVLENVACRGGPFVTPSPPGDVAVQLKPKIFMSSEGTPRPLSCVATGVTTPTPVDQALILQQNASVTLQAYIAVVETMSTDNVGIDTGAGATLTQFRLVRAGADRLVPDVVFDPTAALGGTPPVGP